MKLRLVAFAALSAAIVLGATGCTFITPQATENQYSASDGVNIDNSAGPLQVRNALVIANDDGTVGNLIAAIVNPTSERETLTITVADLDPMTVVVPAGKTVSLGSNDEPLRIDDLNSKPGTVVSILFQSGDSIGVKSDVPVLNGNLPFYEDLVPTAE